MGNDLKRDWLEATTTGDIDRVRTLLDAGADIDAFDKHGQTALMNAAYKGDAAMVRALAERGANLNHTAKYHLTALMLAVINDHADVVRALLAAGADPNIKGSVGHFARTPLEYAEEHKLSHLVGLLRDGI